MITVEPLDVIIPRPGQTTTYTSCFPSFEAYSGDMGKPIVLLVYAPSGAYGMAKL
jgi:hypothetical protein